MSKIERLVMVASLMGAAFLIGRYTERIVSDADRLTSSREFRQATLSGQQEKRIIDTYFGDLLKSPPMKGLGKWSKKKSSR